MSVRTLLVTFLALVCGGSAAIGVNMFLNARTAKAETETVPVLVAIIDIERATPITADHIRTCDWPKELVPPGALSKAEDVIGRTTLERLVQNEPVMENKLASKSAGKGFLALVKPGMRAKAILTPSLASHVAGIIQPGWHVDVYVTISSNERQTGGWASGIILENIEVLMVGSTFHESPEKQRPDVRDTNSITLQVTPAQGLILDVAMARGTLNLVIRNPLDTAPSNAPLMTLADLLKIPPEKAAEVKPPPAPVVTKKEEPKESDDPTTHSLTIIQGGKTEKFDFPLPPKKPKPEKKNPENGAKPEEGTKPAGDAKAPAPDTKAPAGPAETGAKTP